MLTASDIKNAARRLGATVCGIGKLDIFEGENPQRDPKMILPGAKCIIGFGFAVPKGLYATMDIGSQYYTYTSLGVKYIDEEFAEIFLLKMGGLIENEGYDACLQKSVPNLRIRGDKTTNPEVFDTYELIHAVAVEEGKPVPDVIIDFGKAAKACGLGEQGLSGKIINREYGPFMRYCFIITDAPLECDEEFTDKNDLLNCFAFVQHIIENCTDVYLHKYEGYSYGNLYWDELEELYMIAEDVLRSNPDVTGEELKDWCGS